ncbi:inositol 2-dehydrogenase [Aestuariimicrobium ganziense]|uniref:inositol 2-dehydrogenase n=1 Tax=Aestuariimicrobium ganziense TaxID=2773677 RepID=UPI001944D031|nr:inositol 2-dehydrogenase [Aestuariimicrobium ganziense]
MLRFGLFGAGRIGQVHAETLSTHPGTRLVAVHDPVPEGAAALAGRTGARVAADADEIIGDPEIDAVLIGSPTPTHVDLITAAVRAGKKVLCEKPIDLSLARVDECWHEISPLDPTVMIGFNRRFDPSFAAVKQRVDRGDIGDLEQLVITSRDPAPAPAEYIKVSGGIFRDMTIHDFDLARHFLGDVVEVTVFAANRVEPYIAEAGDVDSATVVLKSANGTIATIINSRRCAFGYDQRLEAFGSKGMLQAGNQTATTVTWSSAAGTAQADPALDFFLQRYMPAYRAELDHFVSAVEQGVAPSPDFTDGREALALAEAANESLRTGCVVKF